MDIFRLLIAVPIECVQETWATKMDFGRPDAEIGQKMANGRLLLLALRCRATMGNCTIVHYPWYKHIAIILIITM